MLNRIRHEYDTIQYIYLRSKADEQPA